VAKQVALQNPASVDALLALTLPEARPSTTESPTFIGMIRENMKVQRFNGGLPDCWAPTAITTARLACWCWSRETQGDSQVLARRLHAHRRP